jgi:GPH family glycoside/pentoside/hexuronide:cation symporter
LTEKPAAAKPKGLVSVGEAVGYGVGNFGSQFIYTTMGLFYVYFLTDVAGLAAAVAGIIIFSVRAWDAFLDPVVGFFSDQTNSRWGQKRPYLLIGIVPLAVAFALCFIVPDLAPGGKYFYYVVMLVLMWTSYSVVTVPYNALLPNMTLDAGERSKVAGYYQVFTIIALILIGSFTKPFVAAFPVEKTGWQMVGIVFGVVAMVTLLVTFFTVRERYKAGEGVRYRAREIARLLFTNRPFVVLSVAAVLCFMGFTLMGAMLNYYFKYNLQDENLFSVALGSVFLVAAVSVPLWVLLAKKIGKRTVYMIGTAVYALSMASIYFVRSADMASIVPIFVAAGIGFGGMNLSIWSLVPDTVEYAQWKLGARTEGAQYGFYVFITKLGASVSMFLAGWGLEMAGYVANAKQGAASLEGIRMLTSFGPAAFLVLAIITLFFYPITEKMHAQIVSEIQAADGGTKQ